MSLFRGMGLTFWHRKNVVVSQNTFEWVNQLLKTETQPSWNSIHFMHVKQIFCDGFWLCAKIHSIRLSLFYRLFNHCKWEWHSFWSIQFIFPHISVRICNREYCDKHTHNKWIEQYKGLIESMICESICKSIIFTLINSIAYKIHVKVNISIENVKVLLNLD